MRKLKKITRPYRHELITWVVKTHLTLFSFLPEKLLFSIVPPIAELLLKIYVSKRALNHLNIAFPDLADENKKEIIRRMCQNFSLLVPELITLNKKGEEFLKRKIIIDNSIENMNKALSFKKGVIVISGHIGNWELLAQWGARYFNEPLAVVGKKLKNPGLEKLITNFRRKGKMETIDRDDSPRIMLRHLARPGILGIVPDQDVDVLAGEFIDFMGKKAYTPTGPAGLSYVSGAPIVPAFVIRENNKFKIKFYKPIFPRSNTPKKEEILRLTTEWSKIIEEVIKQYPDQWVWWHKRWSSTPEKVARKRKMHLESKLRKASAAGGGKSV